MTYETIGKNIIDMLIINRRLYNEKRLPSKKRYKNFNLEMKSELAPFS